MWLGGWGREPGGSYALPVTAGLLRFVWLWCGRGLAVVWPWCGRGVAGVLRCLWLWCGRGVAVVLR